MAKIIMKIFLDSLNNQSHFEYARHIAIRFTQLATIKKPDYLIVYEGTSNIHIASLKSGD